MKGLSAATGALLTDLYQLTMAYGYWKHRRSEQNAVFHLFYRTNPFRGGYVIAAGLQSALEFIRAFRFHTDDVEYLASLSGNDGRPLFEPDFLTYLRDLRATVHVDAVPEGTLVFPHEPLLRIEGPILQCQLLETALLNLINFQSLIATKASRIVTAAAGDEVLEFGLRRAQGPDGAVTASRACFVGGCSATSNVLAGQRFGIPVRGTHAHSWVMSFETESEAFQAYADAMPNNCVFLVDTYNTLEGVRHAIQIGRDLLKNGHRMVGIRLDSGDLATLSCQARQMLDDAGLSQAKIVASNDLDEYEITSLKKKGARIDIWGVGTRLVTAYDQPALGGVYKLGAIQNSDGSWRSVVKRSEQPIKTSIPGILQVCRYSSSDGQPVADQIRNLLQTGAQQDLVVDPAHPEQTRSVLGLHRRDMLVPVMRSGVPAEQGPSLTTIRQRTLEQLRLFPPDVIRTESTTRFPVGLEPTLHELRARLIAETT